MVIQTNNYSSEVERLFKEFVEFLESTAISAELKNDFSKYFDYVKEREKLFKEYLLVLDKRNAINIQSVMIGLSRYFDEFNWQSDSHFRLNCEKHLDDLVSAANKLYLEHKS